MPPVSVDTDVLEENTSDVVEKEEAADKDVEAVAKPTIGIIYPPPEVRNIVDKTANFVARNGPEFEDRIRANEANNPKFNFLNPNDPYQAYYRHKLKEFREGEAQGIAPVIAQVAPQIVPQKITKQPVAQVVEPLVPKEPPPEYEYSVEPPSISAMDLDIVKLTAQFVAKNGKQFLTNLMNREQRNYQFDFLRPQHSLFQYFTKLVEQYSKVLLPSGDIVEKMKKDSEETFKVLDRVKYRVEWARYQERERQKEEDARERERVAFAQIDWHDFVVVETVNFREDETANLPPPVTLEQLGARILMQERFERMQETGEINAEEIEMEVEDEDEEEEETEEDIFQKNREDEEEKRKKEEEAAKEAEAGKMAPPLPPPVPGPNVNIRKDYDPKAPKPPPPASAPPPDKYLTSPLTGEKVPVESMAEHMKINLLDPRWKELKQRLSEEKRQQEEVFAEGVSVGSNLKELASYRPDIFGVGAEETFIGKKAGDEEKKSDKVIWDGHTASMERATRLAQSSITLDDQIEAIHKAKGLIPTDDANKIGPLLPKPTPESSTSQEDQNTSLRRSMEDTSLKSMPMPITSIPAPKPAPVPVPVPPPAMMARPPVQALAQPPGGVGQSPILPPPGPPPTGLVMPPPPLPVPPKPGILGPAPGQPPAIPPPPMMMNQPPQMMPPPTPADPSQPDAEGDDEPSAKRARGETESDLIPEEQFLATHISPVAFKVMVPDLPDKVEWRCHGQTLVFTLPLTDQMSVVKAKIHDATGMPAGKQKLQIGSMFAKDSNTLAYYNFTLSTAVQLQLKERGGRKK